MDEHEIDTGRYFLWGCLPFMFVVQFIVHRLNKKDRHHKNSSHAQK